MRPKRPDTEALLEPLKGFQRKTVDYVFERMYLDPDPTPRFLVADEVGLGKTLIARGIVAKAVEHMWADVGRIDVVYICSSVAIAQQNLRKLAIGEAKHHALATRLTLLPQQLKDLDQHKLNFVSFTPATSFDLKSSTGVVSERVVLYWLLRAHLGQAPAALSNFLQVDAGSERWSWETRRTNRPKLDKTLRAKFLEAVAGDAHLSQRLQEVLHEFRRWRATWPWEKKVLRKGLIGSLRMLLARTCVDALEPDLIILDEFQRFRQLLHGDDEMSELARALWNYQAPEGHRARVLLLSATPYRMYSTDSEVGADDHYPDFIATTRFLMDGDEEKVSRFENHLCDFRKAIHRGLRGEGSAIAAARDAVQADLRQVMVRTERVGVTADRTGMLAEPLMPAPVKPADLKQWLYVDELAQVLEERDAVEYWKSAPYLPHFMRGYKLKEKLKKNAEDPEVAAVVRRHSAARLSRKTIRDYKRIDPANARLRALCRDFLDGGQWQLLWVPPTLPYWPLGGPYAKHTDFTKALIFSAWNVVPDVVSAILSYEAERRMLGNVDVNYGELHIKHRGRLLFTYSDERLTGMPVLALQYPSLTLADEACPVAAQVAGAANPREAVRCKVDALIAELPNGEGRPDERWYWAAPAMLDARRGCATLLDDWPLERPDVEEDPSLVTTRPKGDDSRFDEHVQYLARVVAGEHKLGAKPDDLGEVITELALGAPGILAARSLRPIGGSNVSRQRGAAVIAEGLRTLFNQPTAMAVVRRFGGDDVPYWRASLRYAIAGGLQAVLDEHFHQVWQQYAWDSQGSDKDTLRVAKEMGYAAAIKTSRVTMDTLSARSHVDIAQFRLRTSFALRYGRIVGDKDTTVAREGAVRSAFNSPYRPFVLASTSVGQEGLDFHPWCHSIVHWNLPGNPVDLEQREGRVHRYEGHAVRKNVAAKHGMSALRESWQPGLDPWAVIFETAAAARPEGESDLLPWWVYPGAYKVERRIPVLPFSREIKRLADLKRDLVAYRLAFGQPRQQELLELVHGSDVASDELAGWTLDLRPQR